LGRFWREKIIWITHIDSKFSELFQLNVEGNGIHGFAQG
jgi:hypothetical protein